MWESLIGVVIGGGITIAGTYLTNKKEENRFERSLEHEEKKIRRVGKLETLQNVLKPIIEIYVKSDAEVELNLPYGHSIFGDGLQEKYINELKKVVRENNKYIPTDLSKLFNETDVTYDWSMISNSVGHMMFYLEESGEEVINCMFDEKRLFIKRIEQEAEHIEHEYT